MKRGQCAGDVTFRYKNRIFAVSEAKQLTRWATLARGKPAMWRQWLMTPDQPSDSSNPLDNNERLNDWLIESIYSLWAASARHTSPSMGLSRCVLRMINQHRFVRRSKINCNHHHLADVESLDIEVKHKKREEKANYLKNHFSLLFLHRSLVYSQREKKIKFSTNKRGRKSAVHNISTPENLHYFSFKFKVCVVV